MVLSQQKTSLPIQGNEPSPFSFLFFDFCIVTHLLSFSCSTMEDENTVGTFIAINLYWPLTGGLVSIWQSITRGTVGAFLHSIPIKCSALLRELKGYRKLGIYEKIYELFSPAYCRFNDWPPAGNYNPSIYLLSLLILYTGRTCKLPKLSSLCMCYVLLWQFQ